MMGIVALRDGNLLVVGCSAVQLLPPSCFETVSADPVADFSQTVNDIIYVLDEYSQLKYGQIAAFVLF